MGVPSGVAYYTLDGSDPRDPDDGNANDVASGAHQYFGSTTTDTFIPTGDIWKYLDNGSNQGTGWRVLGFNDSGWASGPAELGYGDSGQNRPEATVVSYGPDSSNKYTRLLHLL